jgi:pimeloyl-ACP methyl ester carboxylesterase
MSQFQNPMRAWPGLQEYARTVTLTPSGLRLYVYDAGAPDLPGFGRSDKPMRAYTVPFLCDTVLELMGIDGHTIHCQRNVNW